VSDHFDVRTDSLAQRRAMGVCVAVFLEELLPPLRLAARGCGYALTVHGSLQRDIDLVAIPWTVGAAEPELLVQRLCGVIAGVMGRAYSAKDWTDKPHGRQAVIILAPGAAPEIDLSIMPRIVEAEDGKV
jgi:hypothetical protein